MTTGTKTDIHIFSCSLQKAIRYKVEDIGVIRNKPQSLIMACCCFKERWAKNLGVQTYYDGPRFWCLEGKGCKK